MLGLTHTFAAVKRLTDALNRTAELVEGTNEQLENRLNISVAEPEPEASLLHYEDGVGVILEKGEKRLISKKAKK